MIEWGRISSPAAGSSAPFGGGIFTPQAADFGADQIRSDIWNAPYRGPLDLDPTGGETRHMREMYRSLYQTEGVVTSAIDGKVEGIASADVTIEPWDRHDPASRDEAEFLNWSVEQSEGGFDTIGCDVLRPGFLDGWAALEVTLKPALHPKFGWTWVLHHCRSLDTRFVRLRLDPFRNVTGIVSMVRGLETFSPSKVLIFTHRRLFHNPFGNSDMRPVYRDACLIEDCYKVWYLALKMYAEPYLKGTYTGAITRKQMEGALAALRAGGFIALPEGSDVEILSLSAAVNFQAFEAKVKNLRENIFLAARGSYLPFVEGVGGSDAHGDTKVGKGNADAKEALLGKSLARLYSKQLAPILLEPQFGNAVIHRLPKVKLGGIDWESVEKVTKAVGEIKEKFPGRVSISQAWLGPALGIPPATGPDDEANVADQPPDGGPGKPPGPGAPPLSPSGIAGSQLPPGSAVDGPAALPVPTPPASDFSADHATRYADYVLPDRHGRYPGDLHAQFGLGVQAFADRTGLVRKAAKGGAWLWAPRPAPAADRTFSDAPDAPQGTPGAAELAVAMLDAYAAGDDDGVDALAELADDPEGLAEFVGDWEGGHQGTPGRAAFAATIRAFAAEARTFGWVSDPTPRSKTRATNTESGTHVYGDTARRLLARQGREDRDEPEPAHPAREKAKQLKEGREPAREAARAAWAKVAADPASLQMHEVRALHDHLHTLTRDEVRAQVKQIRGGGHGGKLKADLVDALLDHARGVVSHAKNERPKPADPARLALAGFGPNRYKTVTAGGEEVPAGRGYQRWEGDRSVGYTPAEAERVAAGVTPDHADRRIADHERAATAGELDPTQREYHAELAAQLRAHKETAFPAETKLAGDEKPAPSGAAQDAPARVSIPGYDHWRGKMPDPAGVTSNPKTKKDRVALTRDVKNAWTEARNALAAKYGTREINDRMSDEENAAEAAIFRAMEPLATGGESDGTMNLGPLSDQRYAGYYRGVVQGIDRLRTLAAEPVGGTSPPAEPLPPKAPAGADPAPTPMTPAERDAEWRHSEDLARRNQEAYQLEYEAEHGAVDGVGRDDLGERYDAARDQLERMQAWARDKPESLAAQEAVSRAAARLERSKTTAFSAEAEPTHAGLCVRAAATGRVLLIRRADSPGDAAAGLWEFPGGRIEEGESPAGAACREWAEETGAAVPKGEPGGTWRSADGVYAGHVLTVPGEFAAPPAGDRGERLAWRHPDALTAEDVRPELVDSAADVTRAFADGPPRPGLVPKTGDPAHPGRWVLPEGAGGAAAAPTGDTAEVRAPAPDHPPPPDDQTRAAVADAVRATDGAAAANPTLLQRLGDRAVTAAAKAHLALVQLTPAMLKAIDVVTAVFDTPEDMGKFGFNPTMSSQTASPQTADPVKDATGVSAHLAATIAAKVVGSGLVWVKQKTGIKLYAEEDVALGAATAMHGAFAAVAAEFHLAEPPAVEVIAHHIETAAEPDREFAGAPERKDGDVWQGPSKRWFTRKGGRVVPAKAPGGDAPAGGSPSPSPPPPPAEPPAVSPAPAPDDRGEAHRPLAAGEYPPATVRHAHGAKESAQALFGGDVPDGLLAAAACGLGTGPVSVQPAGGGSVMTSVAGPPVAARRIIFRDDQGRLTCRNAEIEIDKAASDARPGYEVFTAQVRALRQLGVERITALAAGRRGSDKVGYYTWPRLGFDGVIDDDLVATMPPDLKAHLAGSKSLLRLFEHPAGPAWWKRRGGDVFVHFDLSDGSPNMVALEKYIPDRRRRDQGA